MPLKLQNLSVLKLKMMQEKEISVPYNYFFDHFGEDRAFFQRSKPARNALLEAVIGQTVRELLRLPGSSVTLNKLMILRVKEYSFFHGACVVGSHMVNFIYFDDIQLGCVAVTSMRGGPGTYFARFSTVTPPTEPRAPSPN